MSNAAWLCWRSWTRKFGKLTSQMTSSPLLIVTDYIFGACVWWSIPHDQPGVQCHLLVSMLTNCTACHVTLCLKIYLMLHHSIHALMHALLISHRSCSTSWACSFSWAMVCHVASNLNSQRQHHQVWPLHTWYNHTQCRKICRYFVRTTEYNERIGNRLARRRSKT